MISIMVKAKIVPRHSHRAGSSGFSMIEALLSLGIFACVAMVVFDTTSGQSRTSFAITQRSIDHTSQQFREALFRRLVRDAASVSGTSQRLALAGRHLVDTNCEREGAVVILSTGADGIECGRHRRAGSSVRFSYSIDGVIWSDRWPLSNNIADQRAGAPLVRVERAFGVDWIERAGDVQ
jgi:type II secretory pathway component PulJ